MVADGYYAAAAGNRGGGPLPAGSTPAQSPYGQPPAGQSWPPQPSGQQYPGQQYPGQQYPSGQQPASWQQTPAWPGANAASPQAGSAQGVAPQADATGTQYGTPSWPQPGGSAGPAGGPSPATLQAPWPQQQPSAGGSWPGGGQPSGGSWPGDGQPSGPGGAGYPGPATPLGQYAPGRRRPTKADVPTPVLRAVRLMYLGAVVTALNIAFGSVVKAGYTSDANNDTLRAATNESLGFDVKARSLTEAARHATAMAGEIGIVVGLGGLIGVVCWLVIAGACRRGRGWTRPVGTLLLVLYTAGALVVLFGTDRDPGVQATAVIIWIIGLAATIPLWGRQARDFFAYYRR